MRRIYLEIYLTVIGAALVAIIGVAAFGAWYVHQQAEEIRTDLQKSGELIATALPGSDSSRSILQRELRRLADERHVSAELSKFPPRKTRYFALAGPRGLSLPPRVYHASS
jgi:hypothetical protein